MNQSEPLILRTPIMAPELDNFMRVEAFDTHTSFNELIIRYLSIGIEKDSLRVIKHYENTSEIPNYKTVYIPALLDNFLTTKAKDINIGKGTLFMNYLVSGIEYEKGNLPSSLKKWFNSLET